MEIFTEVVNKIWDYIVEPIATHVGYVINYRNNVEELKKEADALKLEREVVLHKVDTAKRNGERIERVVLKWLEEADTTTSNLNELNNEESHSRSSQNIYSRYKLSRQSKRMKVEIEGIRMGRNFDQISYQEVPKYRGDSNIHTQLGSRVLIQNDIMKALKDPMVHTIGVYGLGGVGKTTLVNTIAVKAQQDNLFDVVALANVTQSPNLENIQQEIAGMLGLKYKNEGFKVKACRLHDRLLNVKDERVLIVLDDLWGEFNMDEVGIPNAHNGLKIIMTSRDKEILSNKMNIRKNFRVGVLPKTEAWNLFKEKSQFDENAISAEIATHVAEECGGLPIAIVTVASALRDKDLSEWKDVLIQLQNPALTEITSTKREIYNPIKVSYDKLENHLLKKIFLLCGVMQQNSLVMDLFKNSVGLGLFEGIYILENARNSLYTCIRKLKDLCVLLDCSSPKHFSMHDVVQDVAIVLACSEQHLFIKRDESEEWPEGDRLTNCETIILDYCDFDELPEELYCPSLTFFHLNNKTDSLKIPDRFFKGMLELRVLILVGKKLNSLPSSIRLLSKLRTLCLNLDLLGDWRIIGELKSLRVLTISSATMRQLPLELSQLTGLQLLDLRSCNELVLIPSNILSRLTKLEELYLPTAAFASKAVEWHVVELNELVRLTTLEVRIRDEQMVPEDVVFERLKSYKIIIGSECYLSIENDMSRVLTLVGNISSWHNLKRLLYSVEYLHLSNLKGTENINEAWGWDPAVDSFPNLESLVIKFCADLEEICNGSLTGTSFSRLKAIHVASCYKMKTLFSVSSNENGTSMLQLVELQRLSLDFLPELISFWHEDKRDSSAEGKQLLSTGRDGEIVTGENIANSPIALFNDKVMLPNLEKIKIEFLNKLITIWHWEQQLCPKSFDKLRKMEIGYCEKLVIIFPSHIGNSLHSLETLSIDYCNSLEHVFAVQGVYGRETHSEISGLPIGVLCFPNLQEVHVRRCKRLKYLFPASMAKALEKLQSLEVKECRMIEEIIIKEENNNPSFSEDNGDNDYDIIFSKLKFLKLEELSRLRSFSSTNFIFNFPLLEKFIVIQCPELQIFSKEMPNTPSLQSVQIKDKENESYWEGDLNATIQKIYIDKIGFRSIRLLELTEFPQLEKLWQGHVSTEFKYLTSLVVDGCEFDSNVIIPFNVLKSLTNLEEIQVWNCESVEAVFDLEGINNQETNVTLETKLKKLTLNSLPDLKHVWNGDGKEIVSFQNLQTVTAYECEQLASVFPANIAKGLTQLQELFINHCGVEEIVAKEEGQAMSLSFMFPEFDVRGAYGIETHSEISGLPEKVYFPSLQKVDIRYCERLKYLFPAFVAKTLGKLQSLEIMECGMIEEIIIKEETDNPSFSEVTIQRDQGHEITFSRLKVLKLHRLPKLRSFSSGHFIFRFPLLKDFTMSNCSMLRTFSEGTPSTPSLKYVEIKDWGYVQMEDEESYWEGNLNATIQIMYQQMVGFYDIELSKLTEFPQLEELWQGQVFKEFKYLTYLVVNGCEFDSNVIMPFNVLNSMINLRELIVQNCNSVEAVFDLEGINIQETNDILETCLTILSIDSLPNLKHVWNQDDKEIAIFLNLKTITARKCEQLISVFPTNIAKGLTRLQKLIIEDCGVEEIVAMEEGQAMPLSFTFPELNHLTIRSVPNLKYFYPRDCNVECPKLSELFLRIETEVGEFVIQLLKLFPNLKKLGLNNIVSVMSNWPQLRMEDFKRIESLSLHDFNVDQASILYWNLERIPNLEELNLIDSSIKEVFTKEGHVKGGDNCVHLKCLILSGFYELEHIYKEGLNLHKYLEQLSVKKCCGLKELVPSSAFFNRLGHLYVCKCDGLLHLVTSSTAKSFVQLTILKIKECSKIKEIVKKEENEDIDHEITFSKLKVLEFHQLSSMESFSSGNFKFNFPSLQKFVVNQSPKLAVFSEKIPSTPRLRRVKIEDNGNASYWEGNLNATIQKMYSDMNVEKSIQDAVSSDVDTIP